MKSFRPSLQCRILVIITGALVLNMSFFLAEVDALKIRRDKQMSENIAKLINGSANEEEKDFNGSSENDASDDIELDLFDAPTFSSLMTSLTKLTYPSHNASKALQAFKETLSPPPKS